ncbi:hypothetical protein Tco_1093138 [Tanacetum coccineum]|uniref:Retroviral polymerase SH3-like domain-containing protein n=1 Tax=Tanacetum coccineum TaxID=301880 RepID=A0ABQ5ID66_9ASTR
MEKKSVIARLSKVLSPDEDYLVIYKANRNFRGFNYLMEVLCIFDRQDLYHLYDLMKGAVSQKFTLIGFELILCGDLKIMMESSTEGNNRVLVTMQLKQAKPYENINGRPPSISFMRPFGCPVTILNTLDPIGKFDRKADEGFLVGYSINSKAFRVFNSRTGKVEENLHINFLEKKPNVAGSGPKWLFDIDSLTKSMNYEPVTTGNQTNDNAGIETNVNAGQAGQEKASNHEYILLPLMLSNSPLSLYSTASPSVITAGTSINTASENINTGSLNINIASPIPNDSSMQSLENTNIFNDAYDDREVGAEADLNNLETTMNVSSIPTTRIHKDHPKDQIIVDINSATQTRTMTKISEEHAMVFINKKDKRGIVIRNKARLVAQGYTQEDVIDYDEMDVKSAFLYGTIKEEVYVCKPPSFEDPQFPDKKEDGIFISQDKYVADILKKFDFTTVKAASTPIETNKALNKDEEDEDVDVHLYRSMIGSLMYLTASRLDIIFSIYACARFQVTPKISHLYAVKRIVRYLKGQPILVGILWIYHLTWKPFLIVIMLELALTENPQQEVLWIQNQMLDYGFNFMNSKIHIDNESTICIVKNPVFHSKTKHIEIRHHFIKDSFEKKLIQVIKIHTDHNVADLLTKTFDVSRKAKRTTEISQSSGPIHLVADETVYKEWEDIMEKVATTASSLEAEQNNGNLNRTQSMATLNEPSP